MRVFEKHPDMDAYRVGGSFTPYAIVAVEKRFTDAEMAAELFRQTAWIGATGHAYASDAGRNIILEGAFTFGPVTRDEYEWETVQRFATLPHYDEDE